MCHLGTFGRNALFWENEGHIRCGFLFGMYTTHSPRLRSSPIVEVVAVHGYTDVHANDGGSYRDVEYKLELLV